MLISRFLNIEDKEKAVEIADKIKSFYFGDKRISKDTYKEYADVSISLDPSLQGVITRPCILRHTKGDWKVLRLDPPLCIGRGDCLPAGGRTKA